MNRSEGGTRILDSLGRLIVPKAIRRDFEWEKNDEIEFVVEGDRIYIHSKTQNEKKIRALETLKNIVENECEDEVKKKVSEAIQLLEVSEKWIC